MPLWDLLSQTATVQIKVGLPDRLGVPVDDWEDSFTAPCRLKRESGQQLFDNNQRGVVRFIQSVDFGPDVVIDESMRISQVLNADGSEAAGVMPILSVYSAVGGDGFIDHLEVRAIRIKSLAGV